MNEIFTIGHSTRSEEEFFSLLQQNNIKALADIRRFPFSRRYPHFNGELLAKSCAEKDIKYFHFESLGGRRKAVVDSKNFAWKNDAFRGYADYQETEEYHNAINELLKIAIEIPTCYMCSEAVWWRCHRALVSDDLKRRGWKVLHIISKTKIEEHPYTTVARQQQLF
jgi:uncharacterized protein (DUF488 family)